MAGAAPLSTAPPTDVAQPVPKSASVRHLEGAHREGGGRCVPCPTGTNCTSLGATVVTLPLLHDWWRLPNSTDLRRCFSISNCTGGTSAANLCGQGYEGGPFCGVCSKDDNGTRYHRSMGRCEPCQGSVAPAIGAIAVVLVVLGLVVVALHRSERVKRALRLRNRLTNLPSKAATTPRRPATHSTDRVSLYRALSVFPSQIDDL